ncbi:MAG: sigma-70 family RNA polymerase sigma factor [Desulfobacula sp.]
MAEREPNAAIITEKELVERLKNRQKWAFNHLVSLYQERLFKLAYGMTLSREDSLEVVQDVFISVYHHIETFRQDSSLSTWMKKITIHQCLNWKRKWKRRFKWNHRSLENENDFERIEENSNINDPEILFREKQLENNFMKAIQALPEKIRFVFVLNAIEGLSYDEIAQLLKITKSTVSSRLHLARKNLVDSLELNEKKRTPHEKKM